MKQSNSVDLQSYFENVLTRTKHPVKMVSVSRRRVSCAIVGGR